jgi:TolB-like protein
MRLHPTLAVVPFANARGSRELLPVGEIIADEVIAALSQAPSCASCRGCRPRRSAGAD